MCASSDADSLGATFFLWFIHVELEPDPRTCTLGTPGVCHLDATCTPVTPYVCSSTRPMSYRCECNLGYTGNGLSCEGELILAPVTVQAAEIILFTVIFTLLHVHDCLHIGVILL